MPPRPMPPRRHTEDAAAGCAILGCFGLGLAYYILIISVLIGSAIVIWRAVFGG